VIVTKSRPVMERANISENTDSGDWVVVGRSRVTVVGGSVTGRVVAGTDAGTLLTLARTVKALTPIYPSSSLKYTLYVPGWVTATF
jgi:hypothetical protein